MRKVKKEVRLNVMQCFGAMHQCNFLWGRSGSSGNLDGCGIVRMYSGTLNLESTCELAGKGNKLLSVG